MDSVAFSFIQNGSIFWLPKYDEGVQHLHPGMPRECLSHPCIIIQSGSICDTKVTVVLLTTFRGAPLPRKSKKWNDHLPIESATPHPKYNITLRLNDPTSWDENKKRQCYAKCRNTFEIDRRLIQPWWDGKRFQLKNTSFSLLIAHVNRFAKTPFKDIMTSTPPVAGRSSPLPGSQWSVSFSVPASNSHSHSHSHSGYGYGTMNRVASPIRSSSPIDRRLAGSPVSGSSLFRGYAAEQRLPLYSDNPLSPRSYPAYHRNISPYRPPQRERRDCSAVFAKWLLLIAFFMFVAFGIYVMMFPDKDKS